MRYFFCVLMTLIAFSMSAQNQGINSSLKRELDSIFVLDQVFPTILMYESGSKTEDSLSIVYGVPKAQLPSFLSSLLARVDSSNHKRIKEIIQQYGFPGKSLVGSPTCEQVFSMLQHSSNYADYLPLVKQAAERGELTFSSYAIMLDRSLVNAGQSQVYGTQARGKLVINPQTNQREMRLFIWPVQDAAGVNDLRKAAGFNQSIEENAKRLGIEYKVLTIDDIKNM